MATSNKQGNRDSRDFEDYWHEINEIEQGKDKEEEQEEVEPTKTPDEGEQELAWLKEAGYGHLVSKYEDGKELEDDIIKQETSSLTRAQAEAVRKRVDTLNATLRKKQKAHHKTDVRQVFGQQPDNENGSQGSKSPVSSGGKQQLKNTGKRNSAEGLQFHKKGGFSLKGELSTEGDNTGIETLSIQAKASRKFRQTSEAATQLSPVSDQDVSLTFKLKESMSPEMKQKFKGNRVEGGPDLPSYEIVQETLGITRVSDLSKADLAQIRKLALIELTAIFDIHNITYTRRKNKKRLKEHGLYGVPLTSLMEHDLKKQPNCKVPLLFSRMISFLEEYGVEEEGILRVPGSATRIKQIRQEIEDTFSSGNFSWDNVRPNDIAALMKQFLRELPVPLLTNEYVEAFAQVQNIPDQKQQVQALNLLVLLLPNVHRDTLKVLLKFLLKVVDHKVDNKMNINNVAMIIAPNLFLIQSGRNRNKGLKEIEINMAAGTSYIVKMLIKYQEILWTVPSFMISQVRHQIEAEQMRRSRDKSIMKFLGRKDKSDIYKKPVIQCETDFQDGVIRVQAPHLTKFGTAVQLEPSTTAANIVAKFRRRPGVPASNSDDGYCNGRRRSSSGDELDEGCINPKDAKFAKEDSHLYEVGGNIGERRLDPRTNMLALYRVNPNAEWIIKGVD